MPIQKLPDYLISQIQSSTAITSRYSIIKELLENSIDSEATDISIHISKKEIRIKDNGKGIKEEDFKFICRRNCTSKLNLPDWCYDELENHSENGKNCDENLKENVHFKKKLQEHDIKKQKLIENFDINNFIEFYGFRGEALSCIADCCTIEIESNNNNKYGYSCKFGIKEEEFYLTNYGQTLDLKKKVMEKGTTITLTNIFRNNDLRQKQSIRDYKKDNEKIRVLCVVYSMVKCNLELWIDNKNILLINNKITENMISNESNFLIDRKKNIFSKNFPILHQLKHESSFYDNIPTKRTNKLEKSTIFLMYALSNKPLIILVINDRYCTPPKYLKKHILEKSMACYIEINTSGDFNVEGKMDVIIDERIFKKIMEMIKKIEGVFVVKQDNSQKHTKTQEYDKNKNSQNLSFQKIYVNEQSDLKEMFQNIQDRNSQKNHVNEQSDLKEMFENKDRKIENKSCCAHDMEPKKSQLTFNNKDFKFIGYHDKYFFVQFQSDLLTCEIDNLILKYLRESSSKKTRNFYTKTYFRNNQELVQLLNLYDISIFNDHISFPCDIEIDHLYFIEKLTNLLGKTKENNFIDNELKKILCESYILKCKDRKDYENFFKEIKKKISLKNCFKKITGLKELYKAFERT